MRGGAAQPRWQRAGAAAGSEPGPAPWQQIIDGIVAEVDGVLGNDGALLDGEVVDEGELAALALPTALDEVRIPSRRRARRRVAGR